MNVALCLGFAVLVGISACGGGNEPNKVASSKAEASSPSAAKQDRNACHLLAHDEVSALVEKEIVMSDQVEAGETWSTCQWEDKDGQALFTLTAYWTEGKSTWEAWRTAQGLGDRYFQKAEGVRPDEIVKQGPVPGIGDAAYFSELLPCLVLKGDTLFEFNMFFVPNPGTKFRPLAEKLLAKVGQAQK